MGDIEKHFTKLEWISAKVLKTPQINRRKIAKGAIILSMVDEVIDIFPNLKQYFYIIEWRGWKGMNYAQNADIKLVEDSSTLEETRRRFPKSISLDIALGDFVDTDEFRPLRKRKKYTGIQIASWVDFKRHELFVKASSLLPKHKFIKFGHFPDSGVSKELALKKHIIKLASDIEAQIYFPFASLETNIGLPDSPNEINNYINSAKMGILTSQKEGMNRFKMECLAADIPFLVPADSCYPIKKHIKTNQTGMLFEPTPEGLAKTILYVESNLHRFQPRQYILENTGKRISIAKLENALNELAIRDGNPPYFENLSFDGRNQSFYWGRKAIEFIEDLLKEQPRLKNLKYR